MVSVRPLRPPPVGGRYAGSSLCVKMARAHGRELRRASVAYASLLPRLPARTSRPVLRRARLARKTVCPGFLPSGPGLRGPAASVPLCRFPFGGSPLCRALPEGLGGSPCVVKEPPLKLCARVPRSLSLNPPLGNEEPSRLTRISPPLDSGERGEKFSSPQKRQNQKKRLGFASISTTRPDPTKRETHPKTETYREAACFLSSSSSRYSRIKRKQLGNKNN